MILFRKKSVLAVSTGYQVISRPNLPLMKLKYKNVWKNKLIPLQQLAITTKQIAKPQQPPAIRTLVYQVKQTLPCTKRVLEVGCSTGYHGEIFDRARLKIIYSGCDYSPDFIRLAREQYPQNTFKICDATALDYPNNSYDMVISGCCILHIIDYKKAIAEAARVARKYVIFHRTPVIHSQTTTYTKKIGYGLEMIEILFKESDLLDLFKKAHLVVSEIITCGSFSVPGVTEPVFIKNYLCHKTK